MTQISYSSIISHFQTFGSQFWDLVQCPFVFTQHLRTTHPDEGAVGVLSGGASRHNGGCSGEPAVHRDKSNSKPRNSNEIQSKIKRKNKPDSRGTKEKGALAQGGGGKESCNIKRQFSTIFSLFNISYITQGRLRLAKQKMSQTAFDPFAVTANIQHHYTHSLHSLCATVYVSGIVNQPTSTGKSMVVKVMAGWSRVAAL